MPGFGVLTHIGRASGRLYRTPLLVFRREDGYVVGMYHGSDVNWVKNVFAAGGGRPHWQAIGDPRTFLSTIASHPEVACPATSVHDST